MSVAPPEGMAQGDEPSGAPQGTGQGDNPSGPDTPQAPKSAEAGKQATGADDATEADAERKPKTTPDEAAAKAGGLMKESRKAADEGRPGRAYDLAAKALKAAEAFPNDEDCRAVAAEARDALREIEEEHPTKGKSGVGLPHTEKPLIDR